MSFSSDVKEALSKITNLTDKEAVKYELLGYLISQNTTCNKQKIQYTTEMNTPLIDLENYYLIVE